MTVTRAWVWLVVLSAIATAVAATGLSGPWLALGLLPLTWAKAQIILSHYLHLSRAPAIARGFALVLGLFMALLAGLAILPGAMQG